MLFIIDLMIPHNGMNSINGDSHAYGTAILFLNYP